MSARKAFYNTLKPHEAAPDNVYVDWQAALGFDDLKQMIVNQISYSADAAQVLVTGQKGAGKSTELRRVVDRLRAANCFVSFQTGEFVSELGGDVTAADIVYFAAHQLVTDLQKHGLATAGGAAWDSWWQTFKDGAKHVASVNGPGGFGISLKDNPPNVRGQLRRLFAQQQSEFMRLVNEQVIMPALAQLRDTGIERITLIVDQLGHIPLRSAGDSLHPGKTNHEQIFVDNGDALAGFACDVVFTFPVELAYQSILLGNHSRGSVVEIGVVPLRTRSGDGTNGVDIVRQMLAKRAEAAGAALDELVATDASDRLIECSGGHLRTLFELLRETIVRADPVGTGPIELALIERAIHKRADELMRGVLDTHRQALDHVQRTGDPPADALRPAFNELLASQHVLAHYDAGGTWYSVHPLVGLRMAP